MPPFGVPEVEDNPSGWGPVREPAQFSGLPYAPFSRADRLGRAADWTNAGYNKYQGRYGDKSGGGGGAGGQTVFNFYADADEDQFHLVDNKPQPKPGFRPRRPWQQRPPRRDGPQDPKDITGAEREKQRRALAKQKKQQQWGAGYWNQLERWNKVQLSSSVEIRPEWTVVEQFDLSAMTKLTFPPPAASDVCGAGSVRNYDRTYDRLTPKMEKALVRSHKKPLDTVSTSDDPIIQKLAKEGKGQVFATDAILSTLMTAPRSVYSWDVFVQRVGDKLFFDSRDSSADLVTVSETGQGLHQDQDDKDSINSIHNLAVEATLINQNVREQCLTSGEKETKLGSADPMAGRGGRPAGGYKYRSWSLTDDCTLVCRCGVDAVLKGKDGKQLVSVKALNEYDSKITGVDWRQKIENQRGAVMATELKNNANKLAKWTAQALLGGVDLLKMVFVSRNNPRDPNSHAILATQAYKPRDFAQQINLAESNVWGIVKAIVDQCMKMPEGKYLIVRDPNKQLIRLYDVPADAFEADGDYTDEPFN